MLVDEEATKTGDLYIRSVCFSPDGRYLATGAEDKQIRVSRCLLYLQSLLSLSAVGVIDLGHRQETYPEYVRRPPAGNLLPRLLERRALDRVRLR